MPILEVAMCMHPAVASCCSSAQTVCFYHGGSQPLMQDTRQSWMCFREGGLHLYMQRVVRQFLHS